MGNKPKEGTGGHSGQLVSVEEIVKEHWQQYGRNFYTRYDYEGVESEKADKVIQTLLSKQGEITQVRALFLHDAVSFVQVPPMMLFHSTALCYHLAIAVGSWLFLFWKVCFARTAVSFPISSGLGGAVLCPPMARASTHSPDQEELISCETPCNIAAKEQIAQDKAMPCLMQVRNFVIDKADEFSYKDPVDGSVSEHQGIRFLFSDGSRVIFRLSGRAALHRTSLHVCSIKGYLKNGKICSPHRSGEPCWHALLSGRIDKH